MGRCKHCDAFGDWCMLTEGIGHRVVCWVFSWATNPDEREDLQEGCAYRRMKWRLDNPPADKCPQCAKALGLKEGNHASG